MADDIIHNCGVVAVVSKKDRSVLERLFYGISYSLNRGQAGVGLATYNEDRNPVLKEKATGIDLTSLFRNFNERKHKEFQEKYDGTVALGHVRYGTSGGEGDELLQPHVIENARLSRNIAFVFNGTIANWRDLAAELTNEAYSRCTNDTKVLTALISKGIDKYEENQDFTSIFNELSKKVDGAYSCAMMDGLGRLVVARDPLGIRPLFFAEDGDDFAVASEDIALREGMGFKGDIKVVPPGKVLVYDKNGLTIEEFVSSDSRSHCIFEAIYVMRPGSTIEKTGVEVGQFRENLGRQLALSDKVMQKAVKSKERAKNMVVVPVPKTSIFGPAQGYADELGLRCRNALYDEKQVGRTYITDRNSREKEVSRKQSVIRYLMEGKEVIFVDDSIVEATTAKSLIEKVREYANPKRIHFRSTFPQTLSSCCYGIDLNSPKLIAFKTLLAQAKKTGTIVDLGGTRGRPSKIIEYALNSKELIDSEIARQIKADSVHHQTLEGLIEVINKTFENHELSAEDFCLACVNGKYPTPKGVEISRKQINRLVEAKIKGKKVTEVRAPEL